MPKHKFQLQRRRQTHGETFLGARQLRAFLTKKRMSIPKFADMCGIARYRIEDALAGTTKRITVDFALAVRKATKGAVPVEAWSTATLASERVRKAGRDVQN